MYGTTTSGELLPGQYYDQETGLHYNYFRYYDPSTGRYITSDPIGLDGGLNTYSYALSNPARFADPLGLDVLRCVRPLDGTSFAVSKYSHTYACITLPDGTVKCDSNNASEDATLSEWFADPRNGVPSDPLKDVYDAESCTTSVDDDPDDCLEQCLLSRWQQSRPPYTVAGPFGQNCHEYTSNVITSCKAYCKSKRKRGK